MCPQGKIHGCSGTSGQKIEMNRDKPAALRASDCLRDSKLLRKVKLVVVVSGRAPRSQRICEQASVWRTRSLSIAATSCYALQTRTSCFDLFWFTDLWEFLWKKVGNGIFISHLHLSGFGSRGSLEEAQLTREEKRKLCRNRFQSRRTAHLVDVLEFIYDLADDRLRGFTASWLSAGVQSL